MLIIDDRQLNEWLRQAAEHAASLATNPGAELAVRRGRRRDRRRVGAAVLAMAALVGAVAVVPRLSSDRAGTVAAAPSGAVVRFPTQGFELPVPSGWRVLRQLTGTRPGGPRSTVVGVVLAPTSGRPAGATITITTNRYDARGRGAGQEPVISRPDGRDVMLLPGAGNGEVGRYNLPWAEYPCADWDSCRWPRNGIRGLLVTGTAAPGEQRGRQQVLQVMRQVVTSVKTITNALVPPPAPTVPDSTKVLLGTGGSGDTAWQAWIEPLDGNAGFSVRLPNGRPTPGRTWGALNPEYIQRYGTATEMSCFDWVPGSGLLLSGLAKKETAEVRLELQGHPPVTVATFGRDKQLPWVAYASPVLPAGSRVQRVVGLDSAGRQIGAETDLFEGMELCPPGP